MLIGFPARGLLAALALSVPMAVAAGDDSRRFVSFDVPGVGFGKMLVNSQGMVAVNYFTDDLKAHCFLRDENGTATILDFPGAESTTCSYLFPDGTVVGQYAMPEVPGAGLAESGTFRRSTDGDISVVTVPGWSISAWSGAPTGAIVGVASKDGASKVFLRKPGGKTLLFRVPGTTADSILFPFATNSAGAVAGTYVDIVGDLFSFHTFLRNPDGRFASFDPPGSSWDWINVSGMGDGGAIAGWYRAAPESPARSFLRNAKGKLMSIDPPGALETIASDMSSSGVVVGGYRVDESSWRGFLRFADATLASYSAPVDGVQRTSIGAIAANGRMAGFYDDLTGSHYFVASAPRQRR
jgi:hypothetical protein